MKIETKIKRFIKFLKKLDPEIDDFSLSDYEILEIFRTCLGCGNELISPSQQMHSILEFDTPERAFGAICEMIDINQSCGGDEDLEENSFDLDDEEIGEELLNGALDDEDENDLNACDCEHDHNDNDNLLTDYRINLI